MSESDKSDQAFRTIGEMAKQLGVKTHILRYWEEQFPMLQPLKRAGGRRHYRAEDVTLLETIHKLLNGEGYTIKGARKYLQSNGNIQAEAAPASAVATSASSSSAISVQALKSIRNRLAAALEAA